MNDNTLFARGCRLFHLPSHSQRCSFFLALVSSPGSFSLPVRFIMHKHTLCCALTNPISTIKLGKNVKNVSEQRHSSAPEICYARQLLFRPPLRPFHSSASGRPVMFPPRFVSARPPPSPQAKIKLQSR